MIINRSGITIRMHIADLRVLGRNTQGVKLINLRGKDTIASITKVDSEPDEAGSEEQPVEGEAIVNEIGETPTLETEEGETSTENNSEEQ
jgi:DNA gyrase subunit A